MKDLFGTCSLCAGHVQGQCDASRSVQVRVCNREDDLARLQEEEWRKQAFWHSLQ